MVSDRVVRGCSIVAAALSIAFGITAPLNACGRILTEMQNDFNITAVQTGSIGAAAWAMNFLASPFALFSESFIGYRSTVVLGAVLSVGCCLLASYLSSFLWQFLVYGLLNGFGIGLFIHAAFCVVFKYFPGPGGTRAAGVIGVGGSLGTVVISILYEKIVPSHGWRFALQMTSIIGALLALPASFLVRPNDDHFRTSQTAAEGSDYKTCLSQDGEKAAEGTEMEDLPQNLPVVDLTGVYRTWLRMLHSARAWSILLLVILPSMAWSVYWMNSISYFESISLPEDDILQYVTITTISDLLGRVLLVFAVGVIPLSECNLLLLSYLTMTAVTLAFAMSPCRPVLIVCCALIGIGRGWHFILPYRVGVDLLQSEDSDKGVTLVMLGLGIGFISGTSPSGAIYDSTGSYTYAFVLNAILFFLGGLILLSLQMLDVFRKRKARGHSRGTIRPRKIEESTSRACDQF